MKLNKYLLGLLLVPSLAFGKNYYFENHKPINHEHQFDALKHSLYNATKNDTIYVDFSNCPGGGVDIGVDLEKYLDSTKANTVFVLHGPAASMAAEIACHFKRIDGLSKKNFLLYHYGSFGEVKDDGTLVEKTPSPGEDDNHAAELRGELNVCKRKGLITEEQINDIMTNKVEIRTTHFNR